MTDIMNELVKTVADEFEADCKENGFDTFSEMTRCYGMDSEDIKREVVYLVNETNKAWMDDDSGEITVFEIGGEDPCKYRTFISAVRKELKHRGL